MLFELSWSWYEDYCPYIFEGEEKTKEEFSQDCDKAMIESFESYMEDEPCVASLGEWVEEALAQLEKYGYKRIKQVKYGYFGLFLPREGDKDSDEEKDLPQFSKQIKKMKQYNDKVYEEEDANKTK